MGKGNGQPVDLETARTIARLKRLVKQIGPKKTAETVGRSRQSVWEVSTGKRRKKVFTILDELKLRLSSRLCRSCGKPCGIVTISCRCLLCEVIELAKEGVVTIAPEEKGAV